MDDGESTWVHDHSTELVQLDGDLDEQPHRQLDRPGQLGRLDDAWLDDGWLTQHQPAPAWVKADRLHTLVPRSTQRWKDTYRQRGAVERGFGRLKNEWGMLPLRVRRIERVRLHVDLTILAQLVTALTKVRAVPLAA